MSSLFWENVAARADGEVSADELEAAAYRLVSEQVLYGSDRQSRLAYSLIVQYERDFRQALAPVGISLEVNIQNRYVFARPLHTKAGTATVAQTRLALVLRTIYDESARMGKFSNDGDVLCDSVELDEKYRLMTDMELPKKGDFAALMRTMKRWGIARKADDATDDFEAASDYVIAIRPAIVDVLGETALQRLANWKEVGSDALTDEEDEQEETEVAE